MRFIIVVFLAFNFSIGMAQVIPIVKFQQLEQKWKIDSDTLYVINYWATWCKPCVEELPAFLRIEKELKHKSFKMILVSLDFPQHLETRVLPFIKKHQIKCEVVILDDDANQWINKVNPQWDGSIPVTVLVKNKKSEFYDHTFDYESLLKLVTSKLD